MLKKMDLQNRGAIYDRNVASFVKGVYAFNRPYDWIWRRDGVLRTLEIVLDITGDVDTASHRLMTHRLMTVDFPGRQL